MANKIPVILCADDYAYNQAASEGILELLKRRRLSAVSCMTNMPYWKIAAMPLKEFQNQVKIGLHFNLTEGPGGISLKQLILCSFLHRLNKQEIIAVLRTQIEAFKAGIGRLPDFIDGHQHIHQFPIIREALLTLYQEYYPDKQAAIRISSNGYRNDLKTSLKAFVIGLLGAQGLRKRLEKEGIPHNTAFSGIYSLSPSENYRRVFKGFLETIKPNSIIMCHPGAASTDKQDPIAQAREQELTYFRSQTFLADCQAANVEIM